MLSVRLPPTLADTAPPTDAVATTLSMLPVSPPPPAMGLPGGFAGGLPVVPVAPPELSTVPLELPVELDPQPDKIISAQAPMTSERWPSSISLARLSKGYKVMPGAPGA